MYPNRPAAILGLSATILLAGCSTTRVSSQSSQPRIVPAGSATNEPGSVRFHIREQGSGDRPEARTKTWLATYTAKGKVARFRLELTLKPPSGDLGMAFTSGAFYREPQSDASVFLRDLARVLAAKRWPGHPARKQKLPFQAVILGQDLNQNLSSNPKGTWMATKVFLGDDDAEFFLNLDPVHGLGEISIKDSDYGDAAMKYLAQVL